MSIESSKSSFPIIESYRVLSAVSSDEKPRKSRIYTRTGDEGTSSLFSGERRAKDDSIFEALGAVDELNSYIGLAREHASKITNVNLLLLKSELLDRLSEIQCDLQDLGSHIATPLPTSTSIKQSKTAFDSDGTRVLKLENWIDHWESYLPPLKTFILPSGGLASASLHVCRSVCRRAERRLVPLLREDYIHQNSYKYLNRLSDAFFNAARWTCFQEGYQEQVYYRSADREKQIS